MKPTAPNDLERALLRRLEEKLRQPAGSLGGIPEVVAALCSTLRSGRLHEAERALLLSTHAIRRRFEKALELRIQKALEESEWAARSLGRAGLPMNAGPDGRASEAGASKELNRTNGIEVRPEHFVNAKTDLRTEGGQAGAVVPFVFADSKIIACPADVSAGPEAPPHGSPALAPQEFEESISSRDFMDGALPSAAFEDLARTLRQAADREGLQLAPEEPDPWLKRGLVGGKYQLLRKLGEGGFGAIYEAEDVHLRSRVAIKFLSARAARHSSRLAELKNEARRVTRLNHPNIVDWKFFDELDDGTCYFVMELLKGEDLQAVLRREKKLSPERTTRILLQVLSALRAAHHLPTGDSILHLDLKPRNVFLLTDRGNAEERVKVIDFGISRYIGGDEDPSDLSSAPGDPEPDRISTPGLLLSESPAGSGRVESPGSSRSVRSGSLRRIQSCTPEYASPEQCLHFLRPNEPPIELDGRSDLYSLGVMGYQMLTGSLPFNVPPRRSDWLRVHTESSPLKLSSAHPRVPRRLALFIDRCLCTARDQRFKDADEAYEALHRIVYPPVWPIVARVTVPLVIVFVALLLFFWNRASAWSRLAVLAGTRDSMRSLQAQPLYFGPAARSRRLFSPKEDTFGRKGTWKVMSRTRKEVLAGWSVRQMSDEEIELTAPAESTDGFVRELVHLANSATRKETHDFEVRYLATEVWQIESLHLLDQVLDGRALDPAGIELEAEVRWRGPTHLEHPISIIDRVRFFASETDEGVDCRGPVSEATQPWTYRLALEALDLPSDTARFRVEVIDCAGNRQSRTFDDGDVALVRGSPALLHFDVRGAPQRAGEYLVQRGNAPSLTLRLDRPARVDWSLVLPSRKAALAGSVACNAHHEIDLGQPSDWMDERDYHAFVELTFKDSEQVLHSDPLERGTIREKLYFRYTNDIPQIRAELLDAAALEPTELTEETVFVSSRELKFRVTLLQSMPVQVRVLWKKQGEVLGQEQRRISDRQNSETLLFPAVTDGLYHLEFRLFRVLEQNPEEELFDSSPDRVVVYPVKVDTSPASLLLGGDLDLVLVREKKARIQLGAVDDPDSSDTLTPVDLSWRLKKDDESTSVPLPTTPALPFLVPGKTEQVDLDFSGFSDGLYQLSIDGIDRAGNAARDADGSEGIRRQLTIARQGPALTLVEPIQGLPWTSLKAKDGGPQWSLRLVTDDPNDVQTACARVRRKDSTEQPIEAQLIKNAQQWSGALVFTDRWSEKEVEILLSSTDVHGNESTQLIPFTLPKIARVLPTRVLSLRNDVDLGEMKRVDGNADAPYECFGRDERTESLLFKRVGLPAYRSDDTLGLAFRVGEIRDFYLDENEVTLGAYLAFVKDPNGYLRPDHWPGGALPADGDSRFRTFSSLSIDPALPVTELCWDEAFAFAHWAGKRLPSVVEWEYTVRGATQYRPFASFREDRPEPPQSREINFGNPSSGLWPARVGADKSSEDPGLAIYNLCGNVSEWTATPPWFESSLPSNLPAHRELHRLDYLTQFEHMDAAEFLLAGASVSSSQTGFQVVRIARRSDRRFDVGFRCAVDAEEVLRNPERFRVLERRQR